MHESATEAAQDSNPRTSLPAPLMREMPGARPAVPVNAVLSGLFGAALLSSAFLLFCIEPMVAKMLMPALGGVPAVWNTCLVFFQGTLLAGYLLAFASSKSLRPWAQVLLQAVVIGAPLFSMPILIDPRLTQRFAGFGPMLQAFATLALSAGMPFLALSTLAPTLQRWYAAMRAPGASDPYFLYAASNLGSLAALVAYPVVIEPYLGLHEQTSLLRIGYAVLAVLIGACAVARLNFASPVDCSAPRAQFVASAAPSGVRRKERARWVFLSAVPSAYLVAVTGHLTTDVAPAPFLWVLPLAAYLVSVVLVFLSIPPIRHAWAARLFPLLATVSAYLIATGVAEPLAFVLPTHLLTFFGGCLLCHGELVRTRPDPQRLNEFYVWMSVGGFMGGVAVAVVAPQVLPVSIEYPICLVLALIARAPASPIGGAHRKWSWAAAPPLSILAGALTLARLSLHLPIPARLALALAPAVPFLVCYALRRRADFGWCLGAAMLGGAILPVSQVGQVLFRARNFFGVVRVERDAELHLTRITHGTTLHGSQSLAGAQRTEPLTYYSRRGPAGDVFAAYATLPALPRHVGVIGLGAGTLAAYALPGQAWTFFEINPAVVRIAMAPAFFTFLSDAFPGGKNLRIVIGDARVQIASEPGDYGVLVIDAFSSDAIPVHLVTEEAVASYAGKMAPSGIILWHVSNRHVNLGPVLAAIGAAQGWFTLGRRDFLHPGERRTQDVNASCWIVMSRDRESLASLPNTWQPVNPRPGFRSWTDDRSSVLPVLSL
ncbi:MAG TPA: fused MFS/spermidine synthase [Polyangiaceae bacterium]|jgi:hypothetical protein|nr:fused MFS/spermidine synthase [Polyangiaceae bacterium]